MNEQHEAAPVQRGEGSGASTTGHNANGAADTPGPVNLDAIATHRRDTGTIRHGDDRKAMIAVLAHLLDLAEAASPVEPRDHADLYWAVLRLVRREGSGT